MTMSNPRCPRCTTEAPRRLPDGQIFCPSLRSACCSPHRSRQAPGGRQAQELIGTVVPDPSAFGQVQAPMDGRIELAEHGISHVGQRVEAGEILALLRRPSPSPTSAPCSSSPPKSSASCASPSRSSRASPASPASSRRRTSTTRAPSSMPCESSSASGTQGRRARRPQGAGHRHHLVSNVRAGQVVTTRDTLFEIVDPDRLWIEALGAPRTPYRHFRRPRHRSRRPLDQAVLLGRAPSLRQQSQPLQFKVDEPHEGYIGSAVKVFVQHGDP